MCKTCKVDGCNNKHSAKGYCNKHYLQMMKHGRIIDAEIEEKSNKGCLVEGCENEHLAKGYCSKHYAQIKRCGKILERTIFDENEIIEYDDYAEMLLYDRNGEPISKTKIDLEYIDVLKQYKWHMLGQYVSSIINGTEMLLHRFLMNPPDDMEVDHINRDKLDNRRSNLRVCTHQENDWNKLAGTRNKSGYSGVKENGKGKWLASIIINKKPKHLGTFNTYEEAVEARIKAEKEYFGDFAPTNNN